MAYKNKEDQRKYLKEYYKNNCEKEKKMTKQWRKNHPGEYKEYMRIYHENNREKIRENHKQWKKNNIEKIKKYNRNKYKTNLKFNLNEKIRILINHSLKGNKAGQRWESLVGYILTDLIIRLKKTMPVGYTWQDFLTGELHIDHIIPISAFNFTKPEHIDFKRCWALNNLRLLPARENLIKNAKLDRPFQPALRI